MNLKVYPDNSLLGARGALARLERAARTRLSLSRSTEVRILPTLHRLRARVPALLVIGWTIHSEYKLTNRLPNSP